MKIRPQPGRAHATDDTDETPGQVLGGRPRAPGDDGWGTCGALRLWVQVPASLYSSSGRPPEVEVQACLPEAGMRSLPPGALGLLPELLAPLALAAELFALLQFPAVSAGRPGWPGRNAGRGNSPAAATANDESSIQSLPIAWTKTADSRLHQSGQTSLFFLYDFVATSNSLVATFV